MLCSYVGNEGIQTSKKKLCCKQYSLNIKTCINVKKKKTFRGIKHCSVKAFLFHNLYVQ